MKTSEEQGLSLFPDADFVTCPHHAIAVALITQAAPSVALIDNLPETPVTTVVNLSPATPLLEVLNHPNRFSASIAPAAAPVPPDTTPTIYPHVNRLLNRVANEEGATDALTSHSFRRGVAQHVNGCDGLTERWIFDRGAWNMTTTNKGFNYIFNTTREDRIVSKALSGYDTHSKLKTLNLKPFDTETQLKISAVQHLLFASCYKMDSSKYNLSQQVVDVLTAYLILRYPLFKKLQAHGLAVRRLESAAVNSGASVSELLAWSSHLAACGNIKGKPTQADPPPPQKDPSYENKIIDHQRSVIYQLLDHIKRQDDRMDSLEAKVDGKTAQNKSKKRQQEPSQERDKPKRRRGSLTHLHATWFAWYAQEPRWLADAPKRERSNAKQLVALMKLFVAEDLKLDPSGDGYRDRVLSLGKTAEAAVLSFLNVRGIKSRGFTAIRKHLHELYGRGILNDKVNRCLRLRQAGVIQDPDRQDIPEITNFVNKTYKRDG